MQRFSKASREVLIQYDSYNSLRCGHPALAGLRLRNAERNH